jgi:hypothetical protein
MDVIIVVHTEFGYVRDLKVIPDKSATLGVSQGVSNLIKIADNHNAKITFAVMPEVLKYIPMGIEHEIGLHVHSGWEIFRKGDFTFEVGDRYLREHCDQSLTSTVLRDYPYKEQFEMIKTGADYLEDQLGKRPSTFVAGLWSINNNTVKALVDTGMERDCSAPAHSIDNNYDWSRLPRICMPYHPSEHDYQEKGTLPFLIVPISQMFYGGNVNPEVIPTYGLSWLCACFTEYLKQGMPLFHICLHSPCMTDPYFLAVMHEFLIFISKHKNVNFIFASDALEYSQVKPTTLVSPYIRGMNEEILKIGVGAVKAWLHPRQI